MDVVKKNMKEIVSTYKVKMVGVGLKVTTGKVIDDEICLKFFSRNKAQPNELKAIGIETIPPEIDGIKTDVFAIPTGIDKKMMYLQATLPDDAQHRP